SRAASRPMRATSSRSGASSTARQAAAPIRPEAPRTATRMGRDGVVVMRSPRGDGRGRGGRGAGRRSARRADLDPGAEGAGETGGERRDVVDADRADARQGLVDAGVAAVDELDGAQSAHPGAGVLEPEGEGAGDLPLGARELERVDA